VPHKLLPDDPFLVSYVSYHHFRSLGWVVKPGIKFSCDWLLYRKGPVFSHSAFACVVVPVYEDQEERANSIHGQTDWYEERASWKWVNTVMRVNSLVQKVRPGIKANTIVVGHLFELTIPRQSY
jgi:tRNA-splicing endonuclease subunit Sen2